MNFVSAVKEELCKLVDINFLFSCTLSAKMYWKLQWQGNYVCLRRSKVMREAGYSPPFPHSEVDGFLIHFKHRVRPERSESRRR